MWLVYFQRKIDSYGNLTVSGTVDGVDINGFKSDFDSHTHNFVDLDDTPADYVGYAGDLVRIKDDESGLEYSDITSVLVSGTILYGVGDPPSSVGLEDGTLFFKYVE